jgi:transcriptional regulator GlxA family with amidase domain
MPTKQSEVDRRRVRTIAILASKDAQILDVTGPFQIFVRAAELFVQHFPNRERPYNVILLSTHLDVIQTNCGLILSGAIPYQRWRGALDTLLVAGGTNFEEARSDENLLAWLRKNKSAARRYGSICTGAFLLGSAGLLDGKRVTTHWKWAGDLAKKNKRTTVDPDPIYIRDGKLYTSAGITAGMDLALALVEEDIGSSIALEVAREMVMFLRRPGGQSQFSTALALQTSDRQCPARAVTG